MREIMFSMLPRGWLTCGVLCFRQVIDVINNFPVGKVGPLLPKEKVITTEYLKMFKQEHIWVLTQNFSYALAN